MLVDIVIACCSVLFAFVLYNNVGIGDVRTVSLALTTLIAGAAAALAFGVTGTHLALWRYVTIRDFGALLAGATAAVLGFVAAMFLWDRLASVPRSVPVIQWLVLVVGLCGSRLVYAALVGDPSDGPERRAEAGRWEPVLLAGGGQGAALLAKLLQMTPEGGWRPVGILDERLTVGRMIANVPILGRLGDFERVLAALTLRGIRPGRIVITAPYDEIGLEALTRLRRQAEAARLGVTNLSDLLRFGAAPVPPPRAEERRQAAMARLEHRSYLGAKRLLDIAVSVTVLVAVAPLLALVAVVLRASVGSPVLFRQLRGGRGGRPFVMVKFRTMREAYGPDGRPLPDALRTPWSGRFLRRTRLDELPQFWNVLIGHMSLVGPRPLIERELAELPGAGRERSLVRPGITGWAQVHGGRLLDLEAKLALDLWYVRHASLRLDARILLLTIRMVLLGDRVGEGIPERADAAHA